MVRIFRKRGWELNPKDSVVNNLLRMIENNGGNCPCDNDSTDSKCPCSNYRELDKCCCGLYKKKKQE